MPLALIPKSAIVPVLSGVNRGLRWIVGSSVHGCWVGHYESEKQELVARLVKPGTIVFDVGANAGFYTLAFSRLVGDGGQVVAFEPLAANVRNLRRHIALNRIRNVIVVQAAVSGEHGLAGFAEAPSNSMGHMAPLNAYVVPTVSLDGVRSSLRLGVPALIKIDVEGAECDVLRGAKGTLAEGQSTILLATHGVEQERGCVALLADAGYGLNYLDGSPAIGERLLSDELVAVPAGRSGTVG